MMLIQVDTDMWEIDVTEPGFMFSALVLRSWDFRWGFIPCYKYKVHLFHTPPCTHVQEFRTLREAEEYVIQRAVEARLS